MTQKEFDKKKFKATDRVIYRGLEFNVASVDFPEKLIAFLSGGDLVWVRCENVKYIESKK